IDGEPDLLRCELGMELPDRRHRPDVLADIQAGPLYRDAPADGSLPGGQDLANRDHFWNLSSGTALHAGACRMGILPERCSHPAGRVYGYLCEWRCAVL